MSLFWLPCIILPQLSNKITYQTLTVRDCKQLSCPAEERLAQNPPSCKCIRKVLFIPEALCRCWQAFYLVYCQTLFYPLFLIKFLFYSSLCRTCRWWQCRNSNFYCRIFHHWIRFTGFVGDNQWNHCLLEMPCDKPNSPIRNKIFLKPENAAWGRHKV